MDEQDEYGRPPWRIESTITGPDRIRVNVTITVRQGDIWDEKAVGDCTEIAQVTAATAMNHIQKCRTAAIEGCPF